MAPVPPDPQVLDQLEEFVRVYLADATMDETPPAGKYATGDLDHVPVDWSDLYKFDQNLAEYCLHEPDEFTELMREALQNTTIGGIELGRPPVEFVNLPDDRERDIGRFGQDDIGEAIKITGQVTRKSVVKPKIVEAAFECRRCGTNTTVPQVGGDFQDPHECQGCERQGPFQINAEESEFVEFQRARLQVPPERAQGSVGESVDVDFEGRHLMERVSVGDKTNIVAELDIEQESSGNDKSTTFDWRADGQSVTIEDTDFSEMDVTDSDIDEIRQIAAADDTFQQIVDSIAPSIYGNEDIKLAIALQIFGGVKKLLSDGSDKRGDSHVLLIGDPGTGKTDLIRYASTLVPRSIYTSGKSASGVGLTAAAVRDDFADGEWTLEGGAMVQAHKGLAAVDELDKMDENDRSSMYETLSEQQISVSKAGINATLPAQTKLLAAANPVMGRFDQYQPIADQIDLDPALISRFDLIFIVTDRPDEEDDRRLAEHINSTSQAAALRARDGAENVDGDPADPPIRQELMRKYVAHASELTPVLSDDASERIVNEYVSVRGSNSDEEYDADDPIPTTPRAIEAMHRLAEASARIRLAETVTVDDVERAITLWKSCLEDIGMNPETGEYDADRVETGTSKAQRDRINNIKAIVSDLEGETERGAPREAVLELARDANISENRLDHAIEKLGQQGEIYKPSDKDGNVYYRTT